MIQLSFDQTLAVRDNKRYVFTDGDLGRCCLHCAFEGTQPCRSVAFCEPHRRKDSRNGYWKAAKMTELMISHDQLRAVTSDGRRLRFVPQVSGNCAACAIGPECYAHKVHGHRRCVSHDRADDAWGHWEAVK